MASPKNKAKSSSSQRFNDYLDCLQEEFESNVTSLQSPSARRFNIFLGNLRGEFELLAVEVESLRKGRDKDKGVVVEKSRCNICERCGDEIASKPLVLWSQTKKTPSLFSRAVVRFRSGVMPSTSRRVDSVQESNFRRPAGDHTTPTLFEKLRSVIKPTVSDSRTPASLSTLAVNVDSAPRAPNWSITYNHEVEKELDVELTHIMCHDNTAIYDVKFSQDGNSLAAGCSDRKVRIYDVDTGRLTYVLGNQLEGRDGLNGCICFSRDGKYLATDTLNGKIYVWEIKTKYVRNAFRGHTDYCHAVRFSPNGRLLVSASPDRTVRLWNMRDGTTKFLTEGNPTFIDQSSRSHADFSPDGTYVAASYTDGIVRIWDVRTGRLMRRLMSHIGGVVWDFAFMPDGKGLVSGGAGRWKAENATLKFWDIGSLNASRLQTANEICGQVQEQIEPERVFSGHGDVIFSVATSFDSKYVASGSFDDSVRIWDTHDGTMRCILNDVHRMVQSVDFSPAGCYLASGGIEDGIVRVWKYTYMTRGESQIESK